MARSLKRTLTCWALVALGIIALPAAASAKPFIGLQSWAAPTVPQAKIMRSGGASMFRMSIQWSWVESQKGQYDWRHYDVVISNAASAGLTVLAALSHSPKWAASRDSYPPSSSSSKAAFYRFAGKAVDRYGRGGTFWKANPNLPYRPITIWQVWNEPNLPVWSGGKPNAASYVKLLSGTRAAIKREDSRAIVSTAGMPNSKLRGSVPLTTYLASMYRANGRKKFDLISVHPYAKDTGSAKSILKSVRSVMSKYGDSSKRIAVTELGWASSGPKSSPYVMTKSGQASRLGSCLKMLTGSTGTAYRVMGIIVFSFQDRSLRPGELDWWGPHTGLFDVTGKPKPAWAQFKKYAK